MSLLGIDIGATVCRALAVSEDGATLARASAEYTLAPGPGGAYELDPREVWAAIKQVISEAAAQTRRDPIRALAASSLGEAVTPVSPEGQIIGRCQVGADARAERYPRELEQTLGRERLFEITHSIPDSRDTLARLCYLRDHEPELYHRAWRFLFGANLAIYLLGGASACDYSLAHTTGLLDMTRRRWSPEALAACRLTDALLPELLAAGKPAGAISGTVARELGLPSETQLVVGGRDLCCSALGAGVARAGLALYSLGAYIHMLPAFEAVPLDSLLLAQGLGMEPHVWPGRYVSAAYSRSGGTVLRWFRDQLAPLEARQAQRQGANVYDQLLDEMPEEPTSLMALPHLAPAGPPLNDARVSGAILGLRLDTTRGEIIKALLEGITFYMRQAQERMEEVGIPIQIYRAAGAGARSERWLQLTADILGRPVERPQTLDTACLGAAMLAGVGCGAFANLEQASQALVRVQQRYTPDETRQRRYVERAALYNDLYPLLRDYLRAIS